MHVLWKEDNPAESPTLVRKEACGTLRRLKIPLSREAQTGKVFLMGDGLFALYTGHQIEVG